MPLLVRATGTSVHYPWKCGRKYLFIVETVMYVYVFPIFFGNYSYSIQLVTLCSVATFLTDLCIEQLWARANELFEECKHQRYPGEKHEAAVRLNKIFSKKGDGEASLHLFILLETVRTNLFFFLIHFLNLSRLMNLFPVIIVVLQLNKEMQLLNALLVIGTRLGLKDSK